MRNEEGGEKGGAYLERARGCWGGGGAGQSWRTLGKDGGPAARFIGLGCSKRPRGSGIRTPTMN